MKKEKKKTVQFGSQDTEMFSEKTSVINQSINQGNLPELFLLLIKSNNDDYFMIFKASESSKYEKEKVNALNWMEKKLWVFFSHSKIDMIFFLLI